MSLRLCAFVLAVYPSLTSTFLYFS